MKPDRLTPHTIGSRVRELRIQRKLSQKQLAEKLFVQHTTVSNWEKDIRKINLDQLREIAKFFEVDLTYFDAISTIAPTKTKSSFLKAVPFGIVGVTLFGSSYLALSSQPRVPLESCYGEERCYWIADDAISEELSSRGISNGLMTNVELALVSKLLSQYVVHVPEETTLLTIQALYFAHYQSGMTYIEGDAVYDWSNLHDLMSNNFPTTKTMYFRNLLALNKDEKQLFFDEQYEAKIVLFKTSSFNFTYEIWSEVIDVYKIDLNLERVYLNDELLDPSLTVPDTLWDDFFNSLFTTRTWSLMDESFQFVRDTESRAVFVHTHRPNDQQSYYRFRYFDFENESMYYFEIYRNGEEGRFVNFQEINVLTNETTTYLSSPIQPISSITYAELVPFLSDVSNYSIVNWSILNFDLFVPLFTSLSEGTNLSIIIEL